MTEQDVVPSVAFGRVGWRRVFHRLLKRRGALMGITVILIVLCSAVLAGILFPAGPGVIDANSLLAGASGSHWLGTDDLGRDVFARLVYGSRISLVSAVSATAVAVCCAVPLGLCAGYFRGWTDSVIGRCTDALLSFPYVIGAIALTAILGPSLLNASIAIGISQVPKLVLVIRSEVLSLREEEYVEAAVVSGAGNLSILIHHVLPNALSTIIVQASLILPIAILGEAILSFLGLGVQPPTASWGQMLASAQPYLEQDPALSIIPGLAILLVTLSFNLLGDALRDALDPRMQF